MTSHDLQPTNLCLCHAVIAKSRQFCSEYFFFKSENIKIQMYKSVILPVVLYECETLSLTWRKNMTEGIQEQAAVGNFILKERK